MYQFEAPRIALHFKKSARGTAQKGVYLKTLGSTEIWIPPLAEQRRIVAKIEELFSELDKGIENLKTAQAQLKIYRQALLKHAFEGKLTVAWRAKNKDKLETAEVLLKRIQAERTERYRQEFADWEAGGKQKGKPNAPKLLPPLPAEELVGWPSLPEGWVWLTVKHVCDVVRGGSPRPAGDPRFYGGTIPFLKVADITHADTPYIRSFTFTIKEAGLNKTREIVPNTLLLSNSGATLGVPKICLISATMNDGVAAFLAEQDSAIAKHRSGCSSAEFEYGFNKGHIHSSLFTTRATGRNWGVRGEALRSGPARPNHFCLFATSRSLAAVHPETRLLRSARTSRSKR
jgi:hypothetical protein